MQKEEEDLNKQEDCKMKPRSLRQSCNYWKYLIITKKSLIGCYKWHKDCKNKRRNTLSICKSYKKNLLILRDYKKSAKLSNLNSICYNILKCKTNDVPNLNFIKYYIYIFLELNTNFFISSVLNHLSKS